MGKLSLFKRQQVRNFDLKKYYSNCSTGTPPTTYVNASIVHFKNMKPKFIATQAPKPNSYENFWQMVLELDVSSLEIDRACLISLFLGKSDRDAHCSGGEEQEEG